MPSREFLYACWTFSSARLTALALSIWFSRICFATATALKKQASWSSFESHTGLKKPMARRKGCSARRIIVQIEGLNEVLINEPGLTLSDYKAGAEYPPQQAEGRVRDAVGGGSRGLLMVVEHTKADCRTRCPSKSCRHHETAGYFNIRAEDLEAGQWRTRRRRGTCLRGVKPFAGIFIGFSSFSHAFLLHTV